MKSFIILFFLLFSLEAKTYIVSGGKNNAAQIISSKILKVAYARAGLKVNFKFMQLQESLLASNSGETDAEIARIEKITKLYPNLVIIPVPLSTAQAVAFSKDSTLNISNWSDLKDYNVTIVKGAKFIESATKQNNIKTNFAANFQEAFENLDDDKTKVIVVPKLAGLKYIYLTNSKQIKAVSKSLKTMKLYHFVHKSNKHLVPLLTPILKTMEKSGEINYWKNAYLRSLVPQ